MKPKQGTIQHIIPEINPSQLKMLERYIADEKIAELNGIPKYYMRGDMAYTLDYISDRIKELQAISPVHGAG